MKLYRVHDRKKGEVNMFEIALGFLAGLIVGWNFLPQPNWIGKYFKK